MADVNTVRNVFQQNVGKNIIIDKFFQISDDVEDAEDVRMVNWVISNELSVQPNDGDCFLVEVIRSKNNNNVDGWDILVRYSRNNGWTYVLYYFSIHSRQASEDDLVGVWKGSYFAGQGETALILNVYKERGRHMAIFDFSSLPGRSNSGKGKYYMDVSYNSAREKFYLKGVT